MMLINKNKLIDVNHDVVQSITVDAIINPLDAPIAFFENFFDVFSFKIEIITDVVRIVNDGVSCA